MSDQLEIDQVDIAARLDADPYFEDVTVLTQRKGVTESDIEVALSVLNEKIGKIGVCVVVLMPSLKPEAPDTPSPLYRIQQTVQIIENPLFNLGDEGTGKSAEQLAQRVRQLLHHFSNGQGGIFVFEAMDPIPRASGEPSYGVTFSRRAGDAELVKVRQPQISADTGTAPATVTITCDTAGADIYYTTDGSPPTPLNDAATLYSVPFVQATPATIRAAAVKTDLAQSNTRQLKIS